MARSIVQFVPDINWDVQSKNISLLGENEAIPGYQALARSDNNKTIAVFKKRYVPLLNADFVENAHKISEITKFPIEGFQEINGGKKVLCYLKNNDPNFTLLGERVRDYMVFGNSHDGSTAIFLGNSHEIIRCMNQFGTIVQNMRIRHTATQTLKLENLLEDIEKYFEGLEKMEKKFEKLREIKIDKKIIEALAIRLFEVENLLDVSPRKEEQIEDFFESVEQETADLGNNFWGLFNGVTHYTTHKASNRTPTLGNLWGTPGKMNQKALKFGEELLQAKTKLFTV